MQMNIIKKPSKKPKYKLEIKKIAVIGFTFGKAPKRYLDTTHMAASNAILVILLNVIFYLALKFKVISSILLFLN